MTLNTVADESRKMADGSVAETGRFSAMETLEYDFLACVCALLPTFRFSFFFFFFSYFFPASRYVFLRVHSSVQRPATVKALVRWATGKRLTNCLPKLSLISPNRVPKLSLIVKALVRWATGKRLTNRLPKLSLITLGATYL